MKARVPLYVQVYRKLRDMIREKGFEDGDLLPSEAQLAENFKVGRKTVRSALQRLQDAGLVNSKSKTGWEVRNGTLTTERLPAALIVKNAVEIDCIETVREGLRKKHYGMHSHIMSRGETCLAGNMYLDSLSMIMFVSGNPIEKSFIDEARDNHLPVLGIGIDKEVNYDTISVDNYQSTIFLLDKMLEDGHQHIYFISNKIKDLSFQIRQQAFHDWSQQHPEEANEIKIELNWVSPDEAAAIVAQLKNCTSPPALVCSTYIIAVALHAVCVAAGLSVPQDVSLSSCDEPRSVVNPLITHCALNWEAVGLCAAEIVENRSNGNCSPTHLIRIPPEFHQGSTTQSRH